MKSNPTILSLAVSLSVVGARAQVAEPTQPPRGLTIAFVNVQWGDGVIIVGPTGKCMVFDGGGNGMGTQAMVPWMRKLGVSKVDHLVASHYHADHIGGLDEVLGAYRVDQVWDRGTRNTSKLAGSYASYVRAAGSRRRTVQLGQVFDLGGGARARVLAYDGHVLGKGRMPIDNTLNYENSSSVVLRLDYGDFSTWLGGDLTGGGGKYDMETPVSEVCGDVDVYLANHHGWDDGSNATLLRRLDPEVCVISCSHKNTHNVPHRAVLDRMSTRAQNRLVLSTTPGSGEPGFTSGGTMVLATDGWRYRITAEKGGWLELYTDEHKANLPRPGDLVISELQRTPNRFWGEYVEVYNRSASPLNLVGLRVTARDGSFTVAAPYRVLPGAHLVLAAHGDPSRNGGLPFVHSWPARALWLNAVADDVQIAHGPTLLERLSYGGGFPGGTAVAAERIDPHGGTGSGNFRSSTARYGPADRGSPGRTNSVQRTRFPALAGVEVVTHAQARGAALHFFASAKSDTGKLGVLGLSLGTSPGIRANGVTIPLNRDILFQLFDGFSGFVATVPTAGLSSVRMPVPYVPGLRGLAGYCAHYLVDTRSGTVLATSAPMGFRFP